MTDKYWKILTLLSVAAIAFLVFQWPVIFLMSLTCFGALKAMDVFLWKLFQLDRYDIEIRLPKWLRIALSPFIFCIHCSASIWGSAAYWSAYFLDMGASGQPLQWILFVVATAGLNAIINEEVKL